MSPWKLYDFVWDILLICCVATVFKYEILVSHEDSESDETKDQEAGSGCKVFVY